MSNPPSFATKLRHLTLAELFCSASLQESGMGWLFKGLKKSAKTRTDSNVINSQLRNILLCNHGTLKVYKTGQDFDKEQRNLILSEKY